MKNSTKLMVLIALLYSTTALAQVGRAWAWDAGKVQSNGSVQLKSNNGSSSYSAAQNPTGAVAKTNQSALTQPPTIIIQATSGSTGTVQTATECQPMLTMSTTGTPPIPNCASGYSSKWSMQIPSCLANNIGFYNVAGTNWSIAKSYNSNWYYGWFSNNQYTAMNYAAGTIRDDSLNGYCGSGAYSAAVNLCCK